MSCSGRWERQYLDGLRNAELAGGQAQPWHTALMKRAELDRMGERLRLELTAEDLTLLDTYRRGFRGAYDAVVDRIRSELGLETSGRPAKSTSAIVDKLRRGTMRFTQMQDIAGCRIVVPSIAEQDRLTQALGEMFRVVVVDRDSKDSR
jgi:putative GTP pyrophosphokinase